MPFNDVSKDITHHAFPAKECSRIDLWIADLKARLYAVNKSSSHLVFILTNRIIEKTKTIDIRKVRCFESPQRYILVRSGFRRRCEDKTADSILDSLRFSEVLCVGSRKF